MPMWNVSVRLDGTLDKAELNGLAKVSCEKVTTQMPFLSAHTDALQRGLPIQRTMKPKTEDPAEEEDAQTQEEIRSGKQMVLKGSKEIPSAKVVLHMNKWVKPKAGAQTRASSSGDMEQAAEEERQTQERAVEAAKRKRDADIAKAMALAPTPRKKKAGLPAAKKSPEKGKAKVNLGAAGAAAGGVEDEEPE